MAKRRDNSATGYQLPTVASDAWQPLLSAVAERYNHEYRREAFSLPPEVESMPLFREWTTGALQARLASPFWELMRPQKNQHCLDLGCGLSFLVYPCWREWQVFFHGQEISQVAQAEINRRGPQLNSKLFKGIQLGPAHQLIAHQTTPGEPLFDWVIATGCSCYYPPDYWTAVLSAVRGVLKPGGQFVFDVINPDAELAENWAILETYLGAEVFLEPLSAWEALLKAQGATISAARPGELFQLYRVKF